MKKSKPTVLIIMDGFGLRKSWLANAVKLAKLPNYNSYIKKYPNSTLEASQEAVGLPKGFIGNSEVGHLTLGSGRQLQQDLLRINKAIDDGSFFQNKAVLNAISHAKKNDSCIHLMGLLSDGGVHSHINHLLALIELCRQNDVKKVCLDLFLDGRDTEEKYALKLIKQVNQKIKETRIGCISTLIGRYYAMDRDNRWNRQQTAYELLVEHKGTVHKTAEKAILENYKKGFSDEFIEPSVIEQCSSENIKKGDAIIFFNFRSDRARQITRSFVQDKFKAFKRQKIEKLYFAGMCQYDKNIKIPTAFAPIEIKNTLGQWLSKKGLSQLRLAETEKYAHVTFFFNGGNESVNKKEDRLVVPSPKVATYDLQPEMSANEVMEKAIAEIRKEKYNFILINFANPDMVGHTGKLKPTIKAVETVDYCAGKVIEEVIKIDGDVILTSDHGNCEEMIGKYRKSHTLNKVPVILISNKIQWQKDKIKLKDGCLYNVAPTVLELMGLEKPGEITGESLVVKKC